MFELLEWISVAFNLAFVILVIQEKKIAWPLGIIGSLLSIFLFIQTQLYSEAILYSYYVVVGFYGWITWTKGEKENLKGIPKMPIKEWALMVHIRAIIIGLILSYGLGWLFQNHTDAAMPYADSFSTVFSFIATFMEAKKVLSGWIYWLILNTFSIWLYSTRGLDVYAALMIVYAALSIIGYVIWFKSKKSQSLA